MLQRSCLDSAHASTALLMTWIIMHTIVYLRKACAPTWLIFNGLKLRRAMPCAIDFAPTGQVDQTICKSCPEGALASAQGIALGVNK